MEEEFAIVEAWWGRWTVEEKKSPYEGGKEENGMAENTLYDFQERESFLNDDGVTYWNIA